MFTYWIQDEGAVCVQFDLTFVLMGLPFCWILVLLLESLREANFRPDGAVGGFAFVLQVVRINAEQTRPIRS